MTYADLAARLQELGFTRIERDDRLLDVFPAEQRDKGSELWEYQLKNPPDKGDPPAGGGGSSGKIYILRISEPYNIQRLELFAVPAAEIEQAFTSNNAHQLDDYSLLATSRRPSQAWLKEVASHIKN